MKRILAILLIGMAIAGCDDSTQDVGVTQTARAPLPDRITAKDGVTLESYESQNPYTTRLISELMGEPAIQEELEYQSDLGQTLMVDEAIVARGVADNGRIAELVLIPSSSPEVAGIIVLHVDGGRIFETFGPQRDEHNPFEEMEGKRSGPQPMFSMGCLSAAIMYYQLCMNDCLKHGTPSLLCRARCFVNAVWFFFQCVNFTQY